MVLSLTLMNVLLILGTNASCTDTEGSFTCECNSGNTGDGFTCTDINEWVQSPCMANAFCTNTDGSFNCSYKSGFVVDGDECVNIDECDSENKCSSNATCTDTSGSYICT